MKSIFRYLYVFCLVFIMFSCKNDKKNSNKKNEQVTKTIKQDEKKPAEVIQPIDNGDNMIFTRIFFNSNTKLFASALTSSELTKVFSDSKKEYTVFAPTNNAFKNVPSEDLKLLFSDKTLLTKVLMGHIVEGNLNYVTLNQKIKNKGGTLSLKTLSGNYLKISISGDSLVVKDKKGNKAAFSNKEINAENGVVFEIDKVLGLN